VKASLNTEDRNSGSDKLQWGKKFSLPLRGYPALAGTVYFDVSTDWIVHLRVENAKMSARGVGLVQLLEVINRAGDELNLHEGEGESESGT
jgi:hypothetical protein